MRTYRKHILKVMQGLLMRLQQPDIDTRLFRNIVAVYIIWQDELTKVDQYLLVAGSGHET